VLWCAIDYDLGCVSFGNNDESIMYDMDGLSVSYMLITAMFVLLIQNRCNPSLRHGSISDMKIELYGYRVWCTLLIRGRFKVIIEEV